MTPFDFYLLAFSFFLVSALFLALHYVQMENQKRTAKLILDLTKNDIRLLDMIVKRKGYEAVMELIQQTAQKN